MLTNNRLNYEAMKVNAKTVQNALKYGQTELKAAGIVQARQEALELLSHVSGLDKASLLAHPNDPCPKWNPFLELINQRCQHKPLQYLLGSEFFGPLELKVGPGVLIPRPETELILDLCSQLLEPDQVNWIIDLGTGSGNLALSLAMRYRQAQVLAVDLSAQALRWARRNRELAKIKNVRFYHGHGASPVPKKRFHQIDLVVSNPPYIKSGDLATLQPEVLWEPRQALDGGPDGLQSIGIMIDAARQLLKPQGLFCCEIGINQASDVIRLLQEAGFQKTDVKDDWQGIGRIVYGFQPN